MDTTLTPTADPATPAGNLVGAKRRGVVGGLWAGTRATVGALMGLAPHVMHHVGLLAGAALLTGALGNSILYAAGLLLSIPLLNRLRRRFGTWKAPILGVAAFTVLFGISTFVIGPLINPAGSQYPPVPTAPTPTTTDEHAGHHE